MKKINKKGFTLIELLAVIVVLAIIMVIATQQVNKTIRKSRAKSYMDSALSIEKAAKVYCAENNSISDASEGFLDEYVEHKGITIQPSSDDIELSLDTSEDNNKYKNFDLEELKKLGTSTVSVDGDSEESVIITITDPCKNGSGEK